MKLIENERVVTAGRYDERNKALLRRNLLNLTTTTETDSWIPRDTYAQTVFMAMHAGRVLGSMAAAMGVDIEKGRGDTIRVRSFVRRTAQGPIPEGTSLTSNASAVDTTSIQIDAYGDYDTLTGQSIDFTSDDVKARVLAAMGNGIEEKLEQLVYDALEGEADAQTSQVTVNGEVSYEDVLAAQAVLKKADRDTAGEENQHGPYKPDFLIVGPDHEKQLLLDDALTKTVDYGPGRVALPGEIGSIGSIRIVVHPLANDADSTLSAVQGVMLDSSRAFGEAFGRPLSFEEDRVAESNEWKEVAWVFYGTAVIDPKAICHLKNSDA